jgi:hypothetical protein
MTDVQKIEVDGNQMIVTIRKRISFTLFYEEKDLKRFPWLTEKGFNIVMPTFEGYGYAFNPTEQLWHEIDLFNKSIRSLPTYTKIPENIFRSLAVNENEWDSSCSKIPVIVNTPALNGN